jgi:hypothetical protein
MGRSIVRSAHMQCESLPAVSVARSPTKLEVSEGAACMHIVVEMGAAGEMLE